MQTSYQLVRVFDQPERALGNHAAIIDGYQNILRHDQTKVSADIFEKQGIATTCFISQVNNEKYDVRCFNGSKEIQCCGHGFIAAAIIVFAERNFSSITINENITATHIIEESGDYVVRLNLPRLSSQLQSVPKWISGIIYCSDEKSLPLLPSKSAFTENDDGYLLLEFKPVLPLKVFQTLTLDLKKVCKHTKRAIVLVQFDQEHKHLYMRYFAPQYGVLEDIATGSVMRFVGDYIERNYQVTHFDVSQCSSQGGFMRVECRQESIMITANATIETS